MEIEEIDNQDPFIDKTNCKEIVARIANGDYDEDHDDDFVPDIKPITMPDDNDDEGYSPFDKPLPNGYDNDNPRFQAPKILKSVFCSYRGRLTVYDISGKKVEELSGMLTLDKYNKIEELSDPDTTEFDGYEDYNRIVAELKEKEDNETNDTLKYPTASIVAKYSAGVIIHSTPVKVPSIDEPETVGSYVGETICLQNVYGLKVFIWTGLQWFLTKETKFPTQNSNI